MFSLSRRTFFLGMSASALAQTTPKRRTQVAIRDEDFYLNGTVTYRGRQYRGARVEGLLLNSRMVQGIYDDRNPETVSRWAYPDTKKWDAERNTREFLRAMPEWRRNGLLSFTINLQGGSPQGYSREQPWITGAFEADGSLIPAYLDRLGRILDRADELGFAPILGFFYFGQDQVLQDDNAVRKGVDNAVNWVLGKGYKNLLIEIANECDNRAYQREILKPANIGELIERVKAKGLLAGTSFNGNSIPPKEVIAVSDFVLMHGNGVKQPERIEQMVLEARERTGGRKLPILFNEDDHFDFDQPENNFWRAVKNHASWGYFDPGKSDYSDGYQCPPVNWGINTPRKKAFFAMVKRMAG
jgi:hypothetical protein